MSKSTHMNICVECRKPFELGIEPDYCNRCRVILGLEPGQFADNGVNEEETPLHKNNWARLVYKPALWG